MSKAPRARSLILTVGVTATAITGALYGAGLKTRQDIKKVPSNIPLLPFPCFLKTAC